MKEKRKSKYDIVDEEKYLVTLKKRDWFNTVTRDLPIFVSDLIFRGQYSDKYSKALHAEQLIIDDAFINGRAFSTKQSAEASRKAMQDRVSEEGYTIFMKYSEECQKAAEKLMTFPNFVPAMERAAGFVTDEGGILCHAAIIAREMKKPCVIGTKNATLVLTEGDEILVDAERGVVRKIEEYT